MLQTLSSIKTIIVAFYQTNLKLKLTAVIVIVWKKWLMCIMFTGVNKPLNTKKNDLINIPSGHLYNSTA